MESFIYESVIPNPSICDDIINFHKNSDLKQEGFISGGVMKDVKDSTDVVVNWNHNQLIVNYVELNLQNVLMEYIEKFPMSDYYGSFSIKEPVMIQYYKPGGGFKVWHTERNNAIKPQCNRHLVFMTYLNDVYIGGGTEFYHQKITTQARKGKTVIWPADWTHTHRGVVSNVEEKYIITGWFNFTQEE